MTIVTYIPVVDIPGEGYTRGCIYQEEEGYTKGGYTLVGGIAGVHIHGTPASQLVLTSSDGH